VSRGRSGGFRPSPLGGFRPPSAGSGCRSCPPPWCPLRGRIEKNPAPELLPIVPQPGQSVKGKCTPPRGGALDTLNELRYRANTAAEPEGVSCFLCALAVPPSAALTRPRRGAPLGARHGLKSDILITVFRRQSCIKCLFGAGKKRTFFRIFGDIDILFAVCYNMQGGCRVVRPYLRRVLRPPCAEFCAPYIYTDLLYIQTYYII
jgi:hypothetical protein